MRQMGLLKAIRLTYKANTLTKNERQQLQEERLQTLVRYAKKHSPYFAQKYADVSDAFTL